MLFNSIGFAIFLPIVFFFYWFVVNRNLTLQNFFIVLASYFFYACWDWRFLFLIALTSGASYYSGLLIDKFSNSNYNISKWISTSNIVLNLSILCLFKYFNFFSQNLYDLFKIFGYELDWVTLDFLLPVGISFYTFQALSYSIDVYNKKILPCRDIISFFAFVSFFPQLVAGPIERATNLLPQFFKKRIFNYTQAVNGTRQMLWGFFKKIVVADNCAIIANEIFHNYSHYNGSTLAIGALMFTFQIYGDFSGYSDIAIGSARLFGFDLRRNFNFPYFSRDIAEFWRKWHISLTTWFRDYIYIPLGGSRSSKLKTIRNTFIIFLISGFWHGSNWTFIGWGLYHALLFMPLLLLGKNRRNTNIVAANTFLPNLKEFIQIISTFILVVIGWILFRSDTVTDSYNYMNGILNLSLFSKPIIRNNLSFISGCLGVFILLLFEWSNRSKEFGLDFSLSGTSTIFRYCIYLGIALIILYFGGISQSFIYFQF